MNMENLDSAGIPQLFSALRKAGLPCDDVNMADRQFFRFELDGVWVAYGGLEGKGDDLLLRSMVVDDAHRGSGIGTRMLTALESYAKEHGVERLHLLTTSAAAFFTANGYLLQDRGAAPAVIKQTAQFSSLCPSSASYLYKTLSTEY